MKIVFIRPNIGAYRSADAMQPLVFAILKGLTPNEIETVLFDEKLEDIPLNIEADLIAITIETFTAKRAYEIANHFREKKIPVVMGGFHATALPDEVAKHADAVVIGDAENIWPNLIQDVMLNQLKPFYKSNLNSKCFSASYHRSIFEGKKYRFFNLVQWGRGCRFHCEFCSVTSFYSGKQILRPVSDVIEEISKLKNKTIFFIDDNLYHNKADFKFLLQQLCHLNINWTCQISMDVTKDIELMQLMKKSGCTLVIVGFESMNEECIKQMKKTPNSLLDEHRKAIRVFYEHGIMIYGTFVFGYDADDRSVFEKTADFAIQNKFFLANFNTLYAMPGTPLYQRLLVENRLPIQNWWINPDFYYGKSMIKPNKMTELELENGSFRAKQKFNSFSSILKRIWRNKANMKSVRNIILFLLVNFINRKEILRKQRKKLGK